MGPAGSLLGDTVVFGLIPGGGRGESVVRNPVFTLDYSVLKMNPVFFGGELRGLGLGLYLSFGRISQM